jgi:hypothetical protein
LALPYITGNAPIKLDNVSNLNELTAYWIEWYDNRNIFHSFYQKWKKEIKNTPHLFYQKLFNSENYKAIVDMGWGAVPHIIDQLRKPEEKEPEFLFITLRHAADSNPINPKSIGNNHEMTNDWINWYKTRNIFQRYLLNWLNETGPLSSTQEMFENRYYKAIINMGRDVIPHIIDQLQKKPEHLFKALKEITGMSIIRPEHAGDLYKMAADCIEWYRLYMLY